MERVVSYILADLAKSFGFNEPCSAKINYREDITPCEPNRTITNQFLLHSAAAPTFEALVEWFQKKHNITVLPQHEELVKAFKTL